MSTSPQPVTAPIPITTDGVHKWGGWLAGIVLAVGSASATGATIYATTRGDIRALQLEVDALKAARAEDDTSRKELLSRTRNIEKLLAQLVCKQEGLGSAPCDKAMSAIGP